MYMLEIPMSFLPAQRFSWCVTFCRLFAFPLVRDHTPTAEAVAKHESLTEAIKQAIGDEELLSTKAKQRLQDTLFQFEMVVGSGKEAAAEVYGPRMGVQESSAKWRWCVAAADKDKAEVFARVLAVLKAWAPLRVKAWAPEPVRC